ncbi:MAG: hypothetical protein MUF15_10680 [Acidobacteria bacterium]|jgi:hypothetical protein|nr:hypothetical protein [Acidobacteriota bacterium]
MEYRINGYITEWDRQEIEDILSEAENVYLSKFKLDGNSRLNIYVCKDLPEFIKFTGAGSWNGGHFTNRAIYLQRLAALRSLGILKQTLHHEFIHFLTWRIAGNNCPVWLNEGLALNLTGELQQMDCIGITIMETINRNDIDKLIRSKDKEKAELGYCQAGLLVGLLIRQQGFEKILTDLKQK